MKIILAPNAYKGSISAKHAADVMAEGIITEFPNIEIEKVPFSDGGDGLLEVLRDIFDGEIVECTVKDPLFRDIKSEICFVKKDRLAAIEMAKASGIALLKESEKDPTKTTSYGTGQLIEKALDLGAKKIIVGIGGSATNDGGIGMAAALGIKFLDKEKKEIFPCGDNLIKINEIDLTNLDPRVRDVEIVVVCDVENPLIGENGATRVYGPQKGATEEMIELLEKGLMNLASIIKTKLGIDVTEIPGGGAAGGIGAGFYAFLGASLKKGIEVMKELTGLEEKIKGADLVITGEGKLDNQVFYGKGPYGVAEIAQKYGVPCIAIAGAIDKDLDFEKLEQVGIICVFSICPAPISLDEAMSSVKTYLKNTTRQVVKLFMVGRNRYKRSGIF
ncbi:glycerate kinase [Desulfothermus sp.]